MNYIIRAEHLLHSAKKRSYWLQQEKASSQGTIDFSIVTSAFAEDPTQNRPLLGKKGEKSGNTVAAGTDMAFVKTFRNGGPEVYLPGSSLKGVIRSHAEKIGRTLNEKSICNPFNTANANARKNPSPFGVPGCSDAFRQYERDHKGKDLPGKEIYGASCPACRLFGSLSMKGRFNIGDAYIAEGVEPPPTEYRDGVGIDRFSGGSVNQAKFDFEVITQGEFFATLQVTNFELWQLSLLSYVLRDWEEGLITIGMGSSRGLGMVEAKIHKIRVDVVSAQVLSDIGGIGSLYQGQDGKDYHFAEETPLTIPEELRFERKGIRQSLEILPEKIPDFFTSVQDYFPHYIDSFQDTQTWREKNHLRMEA